MNPEPTDHSSGPAPWTAFPATARPTRTGRRLAVAGVAAAALAVGGVAVAAASSAPSPSATPSGSPPASGSVAPKDHVHTPHLAGTVVSASGTTITITDRDGFQRTIHTSSATTYSDGLTATPKAGTRIVAEGTVDSDKTSLAATRIGTLPDRPESGPGRGWPGGHGGHGRHHDGPAPSDSASPGSPSPSAPSPAPTS